MHAYALAQVLAFAGVPEALTSKLRANDWVNAALGELGGKGGGKPTAAQVGRCVVVVVMWVLLTRPCIPALVRLWCRVVGPAGWVGWAGACTWSGPCVWGAGAAGHAVCRGFGPTGLRAVLDQARTPRAHVQGQGSNLGKVAAAFAAAEAVARKALA